MSASSVTETVGIAFVVDDEGANASLAETKTRLNSIGNAGGVAAGGIDKVDRASKRSTASIGMMRAKVLAAAAAFTTMVLAARKVVNVVADFEASMASVAAVSGIDKTTAAYEQLSKEARRLGATTTFTANQAAEGLKFLAMAGFDTSQQLASLEGTLQLAQAGGLELGRAADIATNILSGFGLAAGETQRVVDVLALAASSANTNVEEMGEAMKFLAPVSAALNIPLEEASAMLAVLANNGLKGGIAGRNLATAFVKLVAPTAEAEAVLSKMGLTLADIDPTVNGLQAALANLKSASIADLSKLFGVENIKSVLVVMRNLNGDAGIEGFTKRLQAAEGTGKKMAHTMTDTFQAAVKEAGSALSEFFIQGAEDSGLLETLTAATDGVRDFITSITGSAEARFVLETLGTAFNVLKTVVGFAFDAIADKMAAVWDLIPGATSLVESLSQKFAVLNAEIQNTRVSSDIEDMVARLNDALAGDGITTTEERDKITGAALDKIQELHRAMKLLDEEKLGVEQMERQRDVLMNNVTILRAMVNTTNELASVSIEAANARADAAKHAEELEDAEIARINESAEANRDAAKQYGESLAKIAEKATSALPDVQEVEIRLKAAGASSAEGLRAQIDALAKAAEAGNLSGAGAQSLKDKLKAYEKIAGLQESIAKKEEDAAKKASEAADRKAAALDKEQAQRAAAAIKSANEEAVRRANAPVDVIASSLQAIGGGGNVAAFGPGGTQEAQLNVMREMRSILNTIATRGFRLIGGGGSEIEVRAF